MKSPLLPAHLIVLATALLARADVLPPAQDSSSLKGKLTLVTGRAGTLPINATRKGFVLFNLDSLPDGVLSTEIASARLRVYFPAAKVPGDIDVRTVTAAWNETGTAAEPGVAAGQPVAQFPEDTVVAKKFVEVDVTEIVQKWRSGAEPNNGFAFVASGLTNVLIGAKEGSGSGYPCELDVEIERALADGSIGATQLANGAITNAKLANSSIVVTAGTGLSGGSTVPLGGVVTLTNTGVLSLTGGGGITVSAGTGAITLGSNATSANIPGTLVMRDSSGYFVAGTIVALGAFNMPTTVNASTGLITQNDIPLLHTFGTQNFFAGTGAGNFTTTGGFNTASGYQALASLTTGGGNTASGYQALTSNLSGNENTGTGYLALTANTTGSANTATGYHALTSNTAGLHNTAHGFQALYSNTEGGFNTAGGFQALFGNSTGFDNTASGYQALYANTTASRNVAVGKTALFTQSFNNGGVPWNSDNVAVGFEALLSNQPTSTTTGYDNTALGTQAMRTNTTGKQNTACGYQALFFNTSGDQNTAAGYAALAFNVDGFSNLATGWETLFHNTSGYQNTASGFQTMLANTTASRNVAVGTFALLSQSFSNGGATWSSENVAVGVEALYSNQPTSTLTGRSNTALGTQALRSNTTGSYNTASGYHALFSNDTGTRNTASGFDALYFNTGGNFNTAIGWNALQYTTGSGNTGIGTSALLGNTAGDNNTAIGYAASTSVGNLTNATAIGYAASVNASNKVRIGNTDVTVIEGQVAYSFPSDRNLKENFRTVDSAEVLRKIRGFDLTSWNYKGQDEKTLRHYGPMAQDFFAAFGHDEVGAIGTDKTMNSGDENGILFSAIQALADENAALKVQLAERDAHDRDRDARISRLETMLPPPGPSAQPPPPEALATRAK